MRKLIDEFALGLVAGDVWVGFIMLVFFYIIRKEPFKIFTYFNEQKSKDIEQAKSLLESKRLGKDSNELIRDHLERYFFNKYYGINTDKKMRVALLEFYKKYQGAVRWHDLKRAYTYIRLDGSIVTIKLSFFSRFGSWVVNALSCLVGLYALLIIVLAVLYKMDEQVEFFILTFMSIGLLVAALLFSTMNWPYYSAIKMRDCAAKELAEE